MKPIQMVDLRSQYLRLKPEFDQAINGVLGHSVFINGPEVGRFAGELERYLGVKHVIPCANGTDALQIALMALNLPQGSEVITAGFSYAAAAEVCVLLKLRPVFVDVDPDTFNINPFEIEKQITPQTRAIIPVHLYGQTCDMESIMAIAEKHNLFVIEDNAQSIGADYTFADGTTCKSGSIGHIATTSFFPSKNLGCYGDGGALYTQNDELAARIRMIANHGQKTKYLHDIVGVNSRLDTLQAAILSVKLRHLDSFIRERQTVAAAYDKAFAELPNVRIPARSGNSTHVFHQYTLQVFGLDIEKFRENLRQVGVPTMVYYPLPLYRQEAFKAEIHLPVSEALCQTVLSLPMGTDMDAEQTGYVCETFKEILAKQ